MMPQANYSGARALVLGASGFIGGWMVRALDQSGATVFAAARSADRTSAVLARRHAAAQIVTADLEQPGAAGRLIDEVRPSIVFNLCGYGVDHSERAAPLMETLNARLVGELCDRLTGVRDDWTGLRLVHTGSALEYGRAAGPLDERMTPEPTTEYGRTKLIGTRHVEEAGGRGLRSVVARLFTVYGAGEHPDRLLASLRRIARDGGRLDLTAGRQKRDFTYVEDVIDGLLRLGARGDLGGAVVNLATGRLTSVRAFAEAAAGVLGIDPARLSFGPVAVDGGEMFHDEVRISRLRDLLSWTPPTEITDGIQRASEYQDD